MLSSGLVYLGINALFASLYFSRPGSILNADPNSYWEAFLFSFQTSTTIGYGHFLPNTPYAHSIAIFDTLSGILFVAILTGLAWGRFSRPTAKVEFTKNVLLTKFDGQDALLFRMANGRTSNIVDARLSIVAIIPETNSEGEKMRRLRDLKLERESSPVFALTWLAIHVIDEASPLYGKDIEKIRREKISLIITCTGIEDALVQQVHSQKYYRHDDFAAGKKFADMLEFEDGELKTMNFDKFHEIVPAA